ncbi:acyl-CoA dehydrogenase [Xylophilus rhododendri]|uniref:3-methylmercaptopropionyl-CoA dehydrogenase n=1 Tax=Xylophilus rhododendri TaxID=2697032 RepID=A0A857J3Z4_9BURK|nr:acyl-CoA dehydrogenase [Xylophilus rhododendri]QHI97849.1 acyl-CoA dehydrogenase [Xylophilus rhododendri]
MTYTAPVKDLLFALEQLAGLERLAALPGGEDCGLDTAAAVLGECARLAQEVIAPLNRPGDLAPSRWQHGEVRTTPGFAAAFAQFAAGGWQGLQHPAAYGGQALPKALAAACAEMVHAASLSFALCPMLSDGAIEALLAAGSEELKNTWLPPLVEGRWTGTMNLTEPQAGSDLAQVRSRAEPQADGRWRIAGTKIFITYGEHDMAENIVHLVLARAAGAPAGVKGISLFLVPKFLPDQDGRPGQRNDVACTGIEHKLGIQASPTAVLAFGGGLAGSIADTQGPGAVGYLVGELNRGLETMFVMMNAARFAVGLQGVAIGERAFQQALAYARERVQGRPVDGSCAEAVPIVAHPDVRRMLMTMRALTEGCRAMALLAAGACDLAHRTPDAQERAGAQARYEFLVPLVKGFATEAGNESASLGVQVHGGMGFIEETGAAQHLRDARILTIYEGTTAIQANDLLGRKTLRDGGAQARLLAADIEATEEELAQSADPAEAQTRQGLRMAREDFLEVVDFMLAHGKTDPNAAYAGSVPYLMLAGLLVSGWQLARLQLAARRGLSGDAAADRDYLQAKIATARFFATHLLPRTAALRRQVVAGAASMQALPAALF